MATTFVAPDRATIPAVTPRAGGAGRITEAAAAVAERVRASVPVVFGPGGNGSGVVWRADGLVVTNSHVVRGEQAEVRFSDGRSSQGRVVDRHPDRDLALLKVETEGLPAVEVGDSSRVRPGQLAIAIGHPLGFREAVTTGVIVAAGQAATEQGPRTGDFIQADVTLLPGNSGGPLLDARGRVIGINTMVNGELSLAIPSQAVERFVAGRRGAAAAYLGVNGVLVPTRRADSPIGFLLTEVVEGTPADRAGLIIGDIVVGFGGAALVDQESLPVALLRLVPGAAVQVDALRGGDPRTFTVVPTERA